MSGPLTNRLRVLRAETGMSQSDLAEAINNPEIKLSVTARKLTYRDDLVERNFTDNNLVASRQGNSHADGNDT